MIEAIQQLERDEEVSHRNILACLARTNSNHANGAGDCVRKPKASPILSECHGFLP